MSRKSHRGIAAVAKNTNKALKEFVSYLKEMGFRKRTEKEILQELLELGVEMPPRATTENAIQDQWIYESKCGYGIIIHTGMVKNEFTDRGSSWALIRNAEKKAIFMREFYRRDPVSLLKKLSAYAAFTKSIVESKIPEHEFVKISEVDYALKDKIVGKVVRTFAFTDHVYSLCAEERRIVSKKEKGRSLYFKNTTDKVRRERTFRTTWKKKN